MARGSAVLDGKVAIVTGAGQGIGRGIALGAEPMPAPRSRSSSATPTPGRAPSPRSPTAVATRSWSPVTCASAPTASAWSRRRSSRFGGVDVLVNNAQQVPMGPLDDCTDDDMYTAWESGTLAAFRLMQLCHPLMTERGGGAIVNLASGAGTEGLPGLGAYAVAKEGIRALTKVAMREWGVDNVRVNTVCPWARTDYWDGLTEREQQARVRHNPLRRIGEPEEIACGGGVPRQRRRRVRHRPDHPRRRRQHGVP